MRTNILVIKRQLSKLWALSRRIQDTWLPGTWTAEVLSSGFDSIFTDKCFNVTSQVTDDKDEGQKRTTGNWRGTFYKDRIGGNGFKLKEDQLKLHIRREFLTVKVERRWNKLPRGAVDAPSWGVFRSWLDWALSHLI